MLWLRVTLWPGSWQDGDTIRLAAVGCHTYAPYGITSLGVTGQITALQKDWKWLGSWKEGGGGCGTYCHLPKARQAAGRDFAVIKAAGKSPAGVSLALLPPGHGRITAQQGL